MRAHVIGWLVLGGLLVLCAATIACTHGDAGGTRDAAAVDDAAYAACPDAPRDPACDDPAARTRYEACQQTVDEAGCVAAGGRWAPQPFPDAGIARCFCPTGQESCPCCRSGDCLGLCHEPSWPPISDCSTVQRWVCSTEYPVLRCQCYVDDGGRIGRICMD